MPIFNNPETGESVEAVNYKEALQKLKTSKEENSNEDSLLSKKPKK